jgi:hypothetical protein
MYRILRLVGAIVPWAFVLAGQLSAQGADLFVCGEGARTFVVAGQEGAPGCQRVAEPVEDLQLSPPDVDIATILDRLSAQAQRIERLERAVMGVRARRSERPVLRPSTDPFDTPGRTRDLGQDIDRALDELSR